MKFSRKPNERVLFEAWPNGASATKVFGDMFTGGIRLNALNEEIQQQDVVLFDGGTDINPKLYGEEKHAFVGWLDQERDTIERAIFIRAQAAGARCVGICRGAQLLTVLSGGKLIQHVSNHLLSHHITTVDCEQIPQVPGDHHQQMWPGNADHDLLAWANHNAESFCDYGKEFNVLRQPEVIWFPLTKSLCIQAHPEWTTEQNRFRLYCRQLVSKYLL